MSIRLRISLMVLLVGMAASVPMFAGSEVGQIRVLFVVLVEKQRRARRMVGGWANA